MCARSISLPSIPLAFLLPLDLRGEEKKGLDIALQSCCHMGPCSPYRPFRMKTQVLEVSFLQR